MPSPGTTSDEVRAAHEIFAGWLRQRQTSGPTDFESLLAAHPDWAQELQALHSFFQLGQAAATSNSFLQTLRDQFGDDAEVTVKLDEGAPFAAPTVDGPAGQPAGTGTTSATRYALEGEVARGG